MPKKPPALGPLPAAFLRKAVILQSELADVVAAYNAVEKTILNIRRRLKAGAAVETGALECVSQNSELTFHTSDHYSLFGLEIVPAESPLRAHNRARRKKVGHA
jgi:hypothetical protein